MDKFPEAYERFEEKIDTSDIDSFQKLLTSFRLWAKKKAKYSKKQKKALAIEGQKKLGIEPIETRRIVYKGKQISYTRKDGKEISYFRKGYIVTRSYNILTGQLASNEKKEND